MMDNRTILAIAGLLGGIGVILGAFGAHALKNVFTAEQLISYEVGVRYQIYHALLLFFIGSTDMINSFYKNGIVYLVILGILMFSGSIYVLNLSQSLKFLWPITPIGGMLLIISWFLVVFAICWG